VEGQTGSPWYGTFTFILKLEFFSETRNKHRTRPDETYKELFRLTVQVFLENVKFSCYGN
jgi:hypothetical protein